MSNFINITDDVSGDIGTGADNRLARYDGTGRIQSSGITVDDSDNITGVAAITVGSATITAGTYTSRTAANIGILYADSASNHVIINSLANGVAGQKLMIVKNSTSYILVIRHNGIGTQKIYTKDGADLYISPLGGLTLECDGSNWYQADPANQKTYFYPDSANTDQGAFSTPGNGLTLYDIKAYVPVDEEFYVVFRSGAYNFDTSIDMSTHTKATYLFETGSSFTQTTGNEVITFYDALQLRYSGRDVLGPIDMFAFSQDIMHYPTVYVFPWISSSVSNVRVPSGLWLDVSSSTTNGLQEAIDYAYGDGTAGTASYNLEIVSRQRSDTGGAIVFTCTTTLQFPAIRQATLISGGFTITSSASPVINFDSLFQCSIDLVGAEIDCNNGSGPIILFQPVNVPPQDGTGQIGLINNKISFGTIATTTGMTAGEDNAMVVLDGDNGYISGNDITFMEINGNGFTNTLGISFINVDFNSIYNTISSPNTHGVTVGMIQIGDAVADMDHCVSNTFNIGGYPHSLATGTGVDCYAKKNIINIYHLFTNPSISFATDLNLQSTAQNNIINSPVLTNITDSSDGSNRIVTSTEIKGPLNLYNDISTDNSINIIADNEKLQLGAAQDMQLYFDETDGNIVTAGDLKLAPTGNIHAGSNNITNLAALTMSGDLTVDTDTLIVDASEDKVGVNTNAPAYELDVREPDPGANGGVTTTTARIGYSVTVGAVSTINLSRARSYISSEVIGGTYGSTAISIGNRDNSGNYGNRIIVRNTGNVDLPNDNEKLQLGAAQDMQLYFDETDGNIVTAGDLKLAPTGNIHAGSNNITNLAALTMSGDLTVDTDTLFVDASEDKVGVGTSTPEHDVDLSKATASDYVTLRVENTQLNDASADARIMISTNNSNGGDPLLQFLIENQYDWLIGIDNSDDDSFVISTSSDLETEARFKFDKSGNVILPNDSDGSTTNMLEIGAGRDMQLYHDGTNSYIDNATGNLNASVTASNKCLRAQKNADSDFDTDETLNTGITNNYGMMVIKETVDGVTGIFRIEGTSIADIGSNAAYTTTKDTASKYNVYFDTDAFYVQNKVGDNKSVAVSFYGA